MEQIAEFANRSLLFTGIALLATQVLAWQIGIWIGRRDRSDQKGGSSEGIGVIVGGILGLLAFMLALTLSQGSARFAERRLGALNEANAIGTAWLRANAIGHPSADAIAESLAAYATLRRDFVVADRNAASIDEINISTSVAQKDMWSHMTVLLRERPDPAVVGLMNVLNEMFDAAAAERLALSSSLRPQVFWLLIGLAHLGAGAIGYQTALRGQRLARAALVLLVVWSAVLIVILDLSAPRIGTLRVNDDPYSWIISDMASG